MKRTIEIIAVLLLVASCAKTVYVPQTKTEYVNSERVDSLYIHDSVFVRERVKGDTIYLTRDRWRTEYRDRLRVDTIIRTDSIPYPVEVVKTEYRAPAPVRWLAWMGGIAIAVCGFILSCKLAKRL